MGKKEKLDVPAINREYNKSNFLIGSKYKASLLENKIMAYALYKIQDIPEEANSVVCKMQAKELMEIMNVSRSSFYKSLEKTAQNMTGRTVGMSDPENKRFHYMAVVTDAKYEDGEFTIEFNKNLRAYLTNIKSNYTRVNIDIQMSFKSNFSFRLWEVLRSKAYFRYGTEANESKFVVSYSISELKLLLGIVNANLDSVKNVLNDSTIPDYDKAVEKSPEKNYDDWYSFKRSVIDVAVKEINEKTNMEVGYVLHRRGRGGKICDITFIIQVKDMVITEEPKEITDKEKEACYEYISELIIGLRFSDVKALAEAAEFDCERISKAYDVMKNQANEVDNVVGFMISALKKNYKMNEAQLRRDHETFLKAKQEMIDAGITVDYQQINMFEQDNKDI